MGRAARVRGAEPGRRGLLVLPWAASPSWVAALYTRREKEDGGGGAESCDGETGSCSPGQLGQGFEVLHTSAPLFLRILF